MTLRQINTNPDGRIGFFAPRTWAFWRAVITCFCACCLIGHWLEFPYCWLTNSLFNCVDDDYALYIDPWFHPYWCYGFGAVGMTLFLEPTKRWFVRRHKTMLGAVGESYGWAVVLAMLMEWGAGVLVNQPDATGHYPYWDNSQLPLNVGGQAWLVNDVFIGLVAIVYLWLMFPLVCKGYERLGRKRANLVFGLVVAVFAACCVVSYTILALR